MSETTFNLTQDHIDLLKHVHIRWSDMEYGAPGVDEKRPFGNSGSSSIEREICDCLGLDPVATDDDDRPIYDDEEKHDAIQTYGELDTALRIVLSCQTFEPGVFVRDDPYTSNWRRMVVEHGDECPSCGERVSLSVASMHDHWLCPECGARQSI